MRRWSATALGSLKDPRSTMRPPRPTTRIASCSVSATPPPRRSAAARWWGWRAVMATSAARSRATSAAQSPIVRTIGLCAALVARERAAEVAITARHPHQRAAAERLGGGVADTLHDAIRVVGRGGRIVLLGSFSEPKAVALQRLMMKEVALLGSFCYGGGDREPEFATAARLTGRWREELGALTSHQFPLD